MPNPLKDLLVVVAAIVCLGAAVILQPWSELNFGFNPKALPDWTQGMVNSSIFQDLKPKGEEAQNYLKAQGAEKNFGDYTYVLVMFGILTVMGIVIILVGREEAEEKTILPLKK